MAGHDLRRRAARARLDGQRRGPAEAPRRSLVEAHRRFEARSSRRARPQGRVLERGHGRSDAGGRRDAPGAPDAFRRALARPSAGGRHRKIRAAHAGALVHPDRRSSRQFPRGLPGRYIRRARPRRGRHAPWRDVHVQEIPDRDLAGVSRPPRSSRRHRHQPFLHADGPRAGLGPHPADGPAHERGRRRGPVRAGGTRGRGRRSGLRTDQFRPAPGVGHGRSRGRRRSSTPFRRRSGRRRSARWPSPCARISVPGPPISRSIPAIIPSGRATR